MIGAQVTLIESDPAFGGELNYTDSGRKTLSAQTRIYVDVQGPRFLTELQSFNQL